MEFKHRVAIPLLEHSLPPLPQEEELFCPPINGRRGKKCFQVLGDNLLATLPRDTEVTVKLDVTAKNLQIDIKRLYTVVKVLEAVRMMERVGMNTYKWLGWDNMMSSLVWLRQMGDKQGMERQLKMAKKNQLPLPGPGQTARMEQETKLNCVMLTQKLLMLFLILPEPRTISLPVASLVIFGPVLSQAKRYSCLQRLVDISQVLQSVGLVKRVLVGSKKSLIFQYIWESVKPQGKEFDVKNGVGE